MALTNPFFYTYPPFASHSFIAAAAARDIHNALASKSSMRVGKIVKHPDGRRVKITGGQYLNPSNGRVSNFWSWREVKPGGKLGKEESGYGW